MKKLVFLLLILPLLAACGSDDDKKDEIPDSDKIAVTVEDIIGSWKSQQKDITHYISFKEDGSGREQKHKDGGTIKINDFKYTIDGIKISIRGGTPSGTYTTEIFTRGNKLYFNNIPFTPNIIQE